MTRIEELSKRLRDSVVKTRDGLGVRCSIQAEDVLAASDALLLLKDAREALAAWRDARHMETLCNATEMANAALSAIDDWNEGKK